MKCMLLHTGVVKIDFVISVILIRKENINFLGVFCMPKTLMKKNEPYIYIYLILIIYADD